MIQWRTFGAAAVLLVSTAASRVSSAGISTRLVYSRADAAASCADETKLRAAVAERLGYDPFVAHATTTMVAEIVRDGSTFRARAYLVDASGIARGWRELSSQTDDCRPVVAALALAISIALDPMSVVAAPINGSSAATQEPSKTGAPPSDATPKEMPAIPEPATPPERRDRSTQANRAPAGGDHTNELRSLFRTAAFLSTGALPATTAGASIQAALGAAGGWSVGIEAAASLPQGRSAPIGEGRVEAWTWTASMVPCLRLRLGALCGLATFGQLVGSGQNVADPGLRTAFFASLGGRAAIEWTLAESLALELYGDLFAPLARHSLALNGNDVWRAPVVAGAFGSAIVFRPR